MTAILATLVPVFLLIALGAALTYFGTMDRGQWSGVERLTYHVLIPPLMIVTLVRTDLGGTSAGAAAVIFVACVVVVATACAVLRPVLAARFAVEGPSYASVFQGACRWNSFAALAIAGSLYGATGIAITAIAMLAMVPLLNVLCVLVHVRHARAQAAGAGAIARAILMNPFIWGTLVGIAASLATMASGIAVPGPLLTALDLLARATLAVSLLLVGGGLELRDAVRIDAAAAVALVLKLVVMPALALAGGVAAGVTGAALGAIVLCTAVPTATASYVMARQMGGNAPLMARIATLQTLAAAASLPFWLSLAAAFG